MLAGTGGSPSGITPETGAVGASTLTAPPGAWTSFRQSVVRFQSEKLAPGLALRNSIGVALPLGVGVAMGTVGGALSAASGALNVSFSDSDDPYPARVRRMLAASVLVGIAVFSGEISGRNPVVAVVVAGLWAFAAGMLVSLSTAAADLGAMSLVTLAVFAAVPQPLERAAWSGLLAFSGGVLQTLLAVAFWPVRRYRPERRALADLYRGLARAASSPVKVSQAPPATAESTEAQKRLAALSGDHSLESERYRLLLSQAERMRLSLLALSRLRSRIARDHPTREESAAIERVFEIAAGLLEAIAGALDTGRPAAMDAECLQQLQHLGETLRRGAPESPELHALLLDARFQVDALTGQLRAALDLAAWSTPEGLDAFVRKEVRRPWRLRLDGTVATLSANLNLRSAACRHAVRLAACVALGDAIGRGFGFHRAYWLPMTIAIVLKPDFTATFSRGVLRLGGTFLGLVFATGLAWLLPASAAADVAAVGALMFVLRWLGPANYGVLVMAVTALVVFLIGLTGVPAHEVMVARGLNTAAGGIIALVAYAVWPTWERTQVRDAIAGMLDAYREYFRGIQRSYVQPGVPPAAELDRARLRARLARSNVEASIDRTLGEPGTPPGTVSLLTGILASSHRLVHAVMALEAGLASSHPVPARAPFRPFANDVELTLYLLAAALRGSPVRRGELPDLREDHHALVHSGDSLTERYALVNVETDRITNSLNTLSEEVLRLLDRWNHAAIGGLENDRTADSGPPN